MWRSSLMVHPGVPWAWYTQGYFCNKLELRVLIWHQFCSFGHFAHLLICSFAHFAHFVIKVFAHFLKWVKMFAHLFILLICSFAHFVHLEEIVLGVPWAWYTQVYYKYSRMWSTWHEANVLSNSVTWLSSLFRKKI